MRTILSYGMGVESTAILLRWIFEPRSRPCALDQLLVITAQTGDEYDDTRRDVEAHILPLMREHGIRYVQVARAGHLEADGIVVLEDSRQPQRLHIEGAYKLSDELRSAGTVPQFGGEHRCSLKFKVFVIERWLRDHFPYSSLHAFGYSKDEPKRVERSNTANAKRIAFGFSADEPARVTRSAAYDTPERIGYYPLIEWGWVREECLAYIQSRLGILWEKSACVYCPFNSLKDDALARHGRHPAQVAEALELELVSLTLNPRGTLYKKESLLDITERSGNRPALDALEQKLRDQPWRVYRVRRLYAARKDDAGRDMPDRKGTAIRAVEHLSKALSRDQARELLRIKAQAAGTALEEKRGIAYLYLHKTEAIYPTREEYMVAGPAAVDEKARYGLDWFEEQWSARQGRLF